MMINRRIDPIARIDRRGVHTLTKVGALLIALSCAPPIEAQCSGAGGGGGGGRTPPAGGGAGGFAAGGSIANQAGNLMQLQRMAALVQQQSLAEQQQRMAMRQRRQALAAARQRQAATDHTENAGPAASIDRDSVVKAAQRRRAAYLRVKRLKAQDEQLLVSADRSR